MSPPRRWARRLLALTGVALLAWAASLTAVIVAGRRDDRRPADAIVVLGAAHYQGRPSPVLRARLDHAIGLWRDGVAPRLVLTGGRAAGDVMSEAAAERRYARAQGVPDSVLLLEEVGRDTRESIAAAAALLAARDIRRVVLVSDPFHSLRLLVLARRYALDATVSPTRTSPIARRPWQTWSYLLSESLKVPATLVMGR
jgi:uncharacterized SAM-binding protein YcdF (DUF218 family)